MTLRRESLDISVEIVAPIGDVVQSLPIVVLDGPDPLLRLDDLEVGALPDSRGPPHVTALDAVAHRHGDLLALHGRPAVAEAATQFIHGGVEIVNDDTDVPERSEGRAQRSAPSCSALASAMSNP